MRSRSTLHKSKLPAFVQFLESRGWAVEPCKGPYEVLRARHPERPHPLIVHDRVEAKEHYTTWGESARAVRAFIRSNKCNNSTMIKTS